MNQIVIDRKSYRAARASGDTWVLLLACGHVTTRNTSAKGMTIQKAKCCDCKPGRLETCAKTPAEHPAASKQKHCMAAIDCWRQDQGDCM